MADGFTVAVADEDAPGVFLSVRRYVEAAGYVVPGNPLVRADIYRMNIEASIGEVSMRAEIPIVEVAETVEGVLVGSRASGRVSLVEPVARLLRITAVTYEGGEVKAADLGGVTVSRLLCARIAAPARGWPAEGPFEVGIVRGLDRADTARVHTLRGAVLALVAHTYGGSQDRTEQAADMAEVERLIRAARRG